MVPLRIRKHLPFCSFTGACIDDANFYRKRHPGTPLLEYNAAVSEHAQEWADYLKNNKGGLMEHASREELEEKGEGENLAVDYDTSKPLDKVAMCKMANAMW